MRALFVFGMLLLLKTVSRIFFRFDAGWVGEPLHKPWRGLRVAAFLHHTSLFEPIFIAVVPVHVLWQLARRGVVPGADKTLRRPVVGTLFKVFAYRMVPVSRRRDHTWAEFLGQIDPDSLVLVAPEGRMMRANGLDLDGNPMTVRGGIADVLRAMDGGRMLLAYSGGLHHVQVPGGWPRLFRTVRIRLETVEIDAYRKQLEVDVEDPEAFRKAVIRDLEDRRDRYCPKAGAPPERPGAVYELFGSLLLAALAPKVPQVKALDPPSALSPWQSVEIPTHRGRLGATWFPAEGDDGARGTVILAHPWVPGGQTYFFRRGRLKALRSAGFHALTFDFPGFGTSVIRRPGFLDRELDAVFAWASRRDPEAPLYFWGVSAGGYWGHMALARRTDVAGAFFEETPAHLIEWSDRVAPEGRRFYAFYRRALGPCYRFLDMRRHAASLHIPRIAYVSGLEDPGVLPEETRELARLADARCRLVPDAAHLDVIKRDGDGVVELALETFGASDGT